MAEQATRHAAELKRINGDHDAELAELRTEIKRLRAEVDELNTRLDQERTQRRAAEDQMRQLYPPDQYRGGSR